MQIVICNDDIKDIIDTFAWAEFRAPHKHRSLCDCNTKYHNIVNNRMTGKTQNKQNKNYFLSIRQFSYWISW